MDKQKVNFSYKSNWFNKIGRIIGFMLSWTMNHSIGWGILHYALGWWYAIYWAIKHTRIEELILVHLTQ